MIFYVYIDNIKYYLKTIYHTIYITSTLILYFFKNIYNQIIKSYNTEIFIVERKYF